MTGSPERTRPLRSVDRHILLAGIVLSLLYLSLLSLGTLLSPGLGRALVGITVTNVIFGRAAAMSLSYALGFGHVAAIPLNMLIETILVLLFYPLFVFSLHHLLAIRVLRRIVDHAAETAEKHEDTVQRYGIPGLVLFVWFPFSMTGPMVGCVIGHMIGLRPWVNVGVVLGSTCLAILCWGLILRGMLEQLEAYSAYAPLSAVAAVMVLLVLVYFARRPKGKSKKPEEEC